MARARRGESGRSPAVGIAARLMNDVGLAAWFAAEVRRAAMPDPDAKEPTRRGRALEVAAVTVHSVGAAYLTIDNRERLIGQRGVLPVAAVKAALTIAAMIATLARMGGAVPGRIAARAGASLTGAALVANSVLGEQQRPRMVARGVLPPGRPRLRR